MIDDYLGAEQLILDRWKAQVTDLRAFFTAGELADVPESQQVTPAGFVIWDGDEVLDGDGQAERGAGQLVDQRWLLVIAVRNVRDTRQGSGVRAAASPLIMKTIQTIAGWKPGKGYREMRRQSAPGAMFDAGFGYFPLLFTTRIST